MERPLDKTIPEVAPRLPVVFDRLKETEETDYIRFRLLFITPPNPNLSGRERKKLLSRLDRGDQCFVARYAGEIVNAGWVCHSSTGKIEIKDLRQEIKLAPDEVYLDDAYTSPQFRNQKIQQARHSWMLRVLRDAGFRRAIGYVRLDNSAQIRALEKTGYQSFAVIGYAKIGPFQHDFVGPPPPPREPLQS